MGILEALGPFGRLLAFEIDEEEGAADGISDGAGVDGETDGVSDGSGVDGETDGISDGATDGISDGATDGISEGAEVDGATDGTSLPSPGHCPSRQ